MENSSVKFTFMGTGAGCGVPAFFCTCPACEEARANPAVARGCCGAMVQTFNQATSGQPLSSTLIDAPPDIRRYLERESLRFVDNLVLTHAHFDHIGGLGELEYMVHLATKQPLPVYGSEETLQQLALEFHYMMNCLRPIVVKPNETFVIDGVAYKALPVTHGPGTYGYLVSTNTSNIFYASDTAKLPKETADELLNIEHLALDATYWKENGHPHAHHSIQEAIEEGLCLNAKKIYLTHMCMHYSEPITVAQLNEYLKQYEGRVIAAYDGLSFPL